MLNTFSSLFRPEELQATLRLSQQTSTAGQDAHDRLGRFGRLLATYYLNLPLSEELPNLFQQSLPSSRSEGLEDSERHESPNGIPHWRSEIASRLPAEYTPTFVVEMLCLCGHWLEALLFVDHFNDLRSA